ncbi:methylthioribose-1-phosphate isomerase [Stella humosa]|uniref:Methylthioribose-1-phosphate isomerase n=1 Tax=Stella humosa TaxID=94 RepID=A0A3N1KNH4_9PROT|nr:S-methyl-5-thioribose-1-phosphate isomerase [Stella humosa]ROP83273.1 methylthioribose-1-phosphate isomerase [Stella humosa]BBK29944.1 methylthioribose-1-phosphate isomerase [Stella humosa]
MKIDGRPWRPIWLEADGGRVGIIDQTLLPHRFETRSLATLDGAAHAIAAMQVRGAPLIGATAAYGVALAMAEDAGDGVLDRAVAVLAATRPTAVNLRWALDRMDRHLRPLAPGERREAAYAEAARLVEADVAANAAIGRHGLELVRAAARRRGPGWPVRILTHCNAGWLATCDWGTALAPIYMAHDAGIPLHVWVDETRPRNQGAALTAWELLAHGVPHTVVADNAGGHLMQRGLVDLCIVGADRVTAAGDVANKIGTYLKALAARDSGVPFHVAVPSSTIDWTIEDGIAGIPIEERSADEVRHIQGMAEDGRVLSVRLVPDGSPAANPAFDVTPARLVDGLITERGRCAATAAGLRGLFPDHS